MSPDYFTINVSSPNTPGLRNLQTRQRRCAELLNRVLAERNQRDRDGPLCS
jgi:dihydroorotate dehydrogenase